MRPRGISGEAGGEDKVLREGGPEEEQTQWTRLRGRLSEQVCRRRSPPLWVQNGEGRSAPSKGRVLRTEGEWHEGMEMAAREVRGLWK